MANWQVKTKTNQAPCCPHANTDNMFMFIFKHKPLYKHINTGVFRILQQTMARTLSHLVMVGQKCDISPTEKTDWIALEQGINQPNVPTRLSLSAKEQLNCAVCVCMDEKKSVHLTAYFSFCVCVCVCLVCISKYGLKAPTRLRDLILGLRHHIKYQEGEGQH